MPDISLQSANQFIAAAIEKASLIGVPSTVTVVDTGGRIVAVGRMDGAPLISIDASAAKARTCVFFGGVATANLVGATQPGAPLYGISAATTEHLAFVPGGLPLLEDGVLLGALGSGGGMPDQDQQIAVAAVAAVTL